MAKLHDHEVDTSAEVVQHLLTTQFPEFAHLPLNVMQSSGTDNRMYRLGKALTVRLPRISWATPQVEKEHLWLPRLAPHLPLQIPEPVALGQPDDTYPWHWSIYRWLEGKNASLEGVSDADLLAKDLAGFMLALQNIPATDGPVPGHHNFGRGVSLHERDPMTRKALQELEGWFDVKALTSLWEKALSAPAWDSPPVWIHGDLQAGNLLVHNGKLHAVIDFGGLGVGDPACDLMVAWNLFDAPTRETFRQALQADDASWERGKGWALSVAVVALPYYRHTNPGLVAISTQALNALLADQG
ncbi:aminoglycoside phosphotransferase family protein [Deinococcus roseus]|uniref:Aminoglycoside phosphotransferase n=1 Tax=Deinococcus roseus TaxID=392414 RepID=A0ABQ2D7E4_9DEIO|nr:aminoglycoside phosphotransferase family protein [Deinococcus roseus]GGJ48722.1 aminoglycoside phosphotransferase [Deinococcus roseus]